MDDRRALARAAVHDLAAVEPHLALLENRCRTGCHARTASSDDAGPPSRVSPCARRRVDIHGQKVSAMDRMCLLRVLPVLIVWGERDRTIPVAHGEEAHRSIPGSRFATIPGAAHFPQLEKPPELARLLEEWIATTEPAPTADADWISVVNGVDPARLTDESVRARG